ncbi:MAG: VWA domain-containing protein [Longimicrobiales bacterium]|nr:VWA domain-containing protein [Longimicrobiales bacterium]
MGILAPAGLLLGLAIAVPVLLHLLHRPQRDRVAFPALQYLFRMERDHARQIRMRQSLLLALRLALLLLLTLAAARTVLRGTGAAHPPTAVVVILDNSMSAGRVVGDGRVLDTLKARARETLELAGPGDRFWIVRGGNAWETVTPLAARAALTRVAETEVVDTRADLTAAVARAEEILARSGAARGEIHLLSDLQASALPPRARPAAGTPGLADAATRDTPAPVVVWTGSRAGEPNGFVRDVVLGGGLPPRAGRRTEVAVIIGGEGEERGVRLLVAGRLEGAVRSQPGASVVLPAGPFTEGPLEAEVEIDPDALRADDRFLIRTDVVPPPSVVRLGAIGDFLAAALDLLEEGGRIRPGTPTGADVVVAADGVVPSALAPGQHLVVVPPADPARRPALSRQLAALGAAIEIPATRAGGSRVAADETGSGLEGTTVHRVGGVVLRGPGRAWVTLEDGTVWAASAPATSGGEIVVLGSPLDLEHSEIPIAAGMVPLVEWISARGGGTAPGRMHAGDTLRVSSRATAIESPSGTRHPVDGTLEFRATREAGIWSVLAGDTLLERVALNTPPRESLLQPIDPSLLPVRLGAPVIEAATANRWRARIFTARRGRELWRPLLFLAFVALLVESWVAASGSATPPSDRATADDIRARHP